MIRVLARQSIDQIVIDRGVAEFARDVRDGLGNFVRLMTINESLHFRIEILNADRDAREAKLTQHDQLFARRVAGMNFRRSFEPVASYTSGREDWLQDAFKIFAREKSWRAATKMQPEQRPLSHRRNAI